MILNEHSDLRGKHSTFSPSSPSFFNYNPEEIVERLLMKYRQALGTEIHDWATVKIKRCHKIKSVRDMINDIDEFIFKKYYIEKIDKLSKEGSRILACLRYVVRNYPETLETVKSYVNDAIGYKMYTEVILYYTDDFFGTADALIFSNKCLRIHDLKTGTTPAHIEQLLGYAALYCIEYKVNPMNIDFELRVYQNNDILIATPTGEDILPFIDRYKDFNNELTAFEGGLS